MKNTNSDLENSVLVYTHVAFIVKIIIAEFHVPRIEMAVLKDLGSTFQKVLLALE